MLKTNIATYKASKVIGDVAIPEFDLVSVTGKGTLTSMQVSYNWTFYGFALHLRIFVDGRQITRDDKSFDVLKALSSEAIGASYDKTFPLSVPYSQSLVIKVRGIPHTGGPSNPIDATISAMWSADI